MKRFTWVCMIGLLLLFPLHGNADGHVPILVYHSIDEFTGSGSKELYVTPESFERQMRYLKENGYTPLTFERWEDIDNVQKPVFITIDDGYENTLNAFQVFQKLKDDTFQPTATLFVISDFIGGPGRLSKTTLKSLADSGFFSIQSHTATHPDLTKKADFPYELKQSKEKIETITGRPVIAFAYPYGNFNDRAVAEAKKYYQFAVTTTPGAYVPMGIKNERYVLPRIYVTYSTSLEEFARALQPK